MSETESVTAPAPPATIPKTTMTIQEIMAILPHRYPFLLIDRVVEMEAGARIVAIKNVTMNEPHFPGHFPDFPVMPGVLMVEAIAQTGGALLLSDVPDRASKLMVFTGIESARFRRMVTPGDQLRIEVKVVNWRTRAVKMSGVITVEGKVVCDAIVTCQVIDRVRPAKPEVTPEVRPEVRPEAAAETPAAGAPGSGGGAA